MSNFQMSQAKEMCIIQFGSTGALIILQQQIEYLLYDGVGIGSDLFLFCSEVHKSISFVLNHGECFVSFVSTCLSIVGTTSLESILQAFFRLEILQKSGGDVHSIEALIIFKAIS